MSYNANGQGERILRDAVAAANAYNEMVVSSFEPKKIAVTQVSEEHRGTFLFGKLTLKPWSILYDWAKK